MNIEKIPTIRLIFHNADDAMRHETLIKLRIYLPEIIYQFSTSKDL